MKDNTFSVGAARVDITPPVGTPLQGALQPRPSKGTDDPLYVKAIVLEAGGTRLAYAIFDLAVVSRQTGDQAIALAASQTGIAADHIVWSASHTHSGPIAVDGAYPASAGDVVDHEWLAALPARFAECVALADQRKARVTARRFRGYCQHVGRNRRVRFKDGREINSWLLHNGEDDLQSVGEAGPTDPEIGILAFHDEDEVLQAVIFQFTLHANTHFGSRFSGDYPAVVAARLREAFGPQVETLFVPGACGDINNVTTSCRSTGNALADAIIGQLHTGSGQPVSARLGARKREVTVPCRDFAADQEARLQASQWSPEGQEFFRESQQEMQARGLTELPALVQAWHIGDVAFASFPGEPFVELGIRLKQQSPFPWTYPVELGGDWLGYLITKQAWEAGGYESLAASTGQVTWQGSDLLLKTQIELLEEMLEE